MRLIDASPFDRLIMSVPEDVYDAQSYVRGVEDILYLIRTAKEVKDVLQDSKELSERECK